MENQTCTPRSPPSSTVISPDRFTLGCFRFRLRLTGKATLPPDKGDLLHRALGRGLEQISPRFGRYFYKPQPPPDWPHPGQTPPKPFLLVLPGDRRRHLRRGDILEFGITLFGVACQHLPVLFAALEKVGEYPGLNGKGEHYSIERLTQITPDGEWELFTEGRWLAPIRPTAASGIFDTTPRVGDCITLEIVSPLRLKAGGRLGRERLPLEILTDRLIGRLNTLAAMYCGGLLLPPAEKVALVTLARTASIQQAQTRWYDQGRGGSGGKIRFGGLAGSIGYRDVPAELLPWLNLGQWTGVGGKTSFGLGLYALTMQKECIDEIMEM